MEEFKAYLDEVSNVISFRLKVAFANKETEDRGEKRLEEAALYSLLPTGGCLRAAIVIQSCALFAVARSRIIDLAVAVELVHAYSLIHDDLPCMDDDDVRRNRPSSHKAFGEPTALLTGNAIFAKAVELIASSDGYLNVTPHVRCALITELMRASGVHGMMAGQMLDILLSRGVRDAGSGEAVRMQRNKTGALFAFSMMSGAVVAQASHSEINMLKDIGYDLGIAYQMLDDIDDGELLSSESQGVVEHVKMTLDQVLVLLKRFRNSDVLSQLVEYLKGRLAYD